MLLHKSIESRKVSKTQEMSTLLYSVRVKMNDVENHMTKTIFVILQ
jgi:hypothetical protein